MRAAELRAGDSVIVRLDGRERRAVVRGLLRPAGTSLYRRTFIRIDLATGQRNIHVSPRLVLRRFGRGAISRGRGLRGSDLQYREES